MRSLEELRVHDLRFGIACACSGRAAPSRTCIWSLIAHLADPESEDVRAVDLVEDGDLGVQVVGVERVIVQCKRHSLDHKIGEPIIKQLFADTYLHEAARGLIVTTSFLTKDGRLVVDAFRYRLSSLDFGELSALLRDTDLA